MNNYIVYEKKECLCKSKSKSDQCKVLYVGMNCSRCYGSGIETVEVSMKDAILDALMTDELFKVRVSSLTWTI